MLITEIQGLRKELTYLRNGLESSKVSLERNKLYNNKEIRLLLGVEERLIKKYRDEGHLPFSRKGDKYWYTGHDVISFLNKNHYDAYA